MIFSHITFQRKYQIKLVRLLWFGSKTLARLGDYCHYILILDYNDLPLISMLPS